VNSINKKKKSKISSQLRDVMLEGIKNGNFSLKFIDDMIAALKSLKKKTHNFYFSLAFSDPSRMLKSNF
jgi:hypothetical protein